MINLQIDIIYLDFVFDRTQFKRKIIIYRKYIRSIEKFVNTTYLTKMRPGSNWYAKTDITDVFIPFFIIVHPKLNIPPQLCQ